MPLESFLLYTAFLVLSVLSICAVARSRYGEKVPVAVLTVVLILFSALRDNIGRDYPIYEEAFYTKEYTSYDHMEWLWRQFYDMLNYFGLEFYHWTLIVAVIFIPLVLWAYRKQSYTLWIALAFFVFTYKLYFESFNSVRQCLAQAVCLFAVPLYTQRKWLPAFLILFLAVAIHRSAAVMVLLLPFFYIRYNGYFMGSMVVLSLAVFPRILKPLFVFLIPYLPIDTYYLENMWDAQEGSGSGIFFMINTVIALYLVWRSKDLYRRDAKLLPYLNSWLISVIICNSLPFFQVGSRLFYYPLMFFPILMSNLFTVGNRYDRILVWGFLFLQVAQTAKVICIPDENFLRYQIIFKDREKVHIYDYSENRTLPPDYFLRSLTSTGTQSTTVNIL